jgi:foldase protein PrsA
VRLPSGPKLLVSATVAALLLSGCAAFRTAAATVDGTRIEDDDFRRTLEFVLADPRFASEGLNAQQTEQQRQDLVRQLLTFLVQQVLVDEYAQKQDIEATSEEIEDLLEQQVEQLGGQKALDKQLRDSQATMADVRMLLRAQIVREKVARDVIEERLPEEELRAEYEERTAEFTTVHLAHILVETEQEALDLLDQVNERNFARLARQHSLDPGSAPQGGDLGEATARDFVEPFAQAALEIPVGEIGGPVQTEFGYHLIHVLDRQTPPFEEIRAQLLDERIGEVFTEWLNEKLQEAEIRVNPRYGIFNPETGRVEERRATTPMPGPAQATP